MMISTGKNRNHKHTIFYTCYLKYFIPHLNNLYLSRYICKYWYILFTEEVINVHITKSTIKQTILLPSKWVNRCLNQWVNMVGRVWLPNGYFIQMSYTSNVRALSIQFYIPLSQSITYLNDQNVVERRNGATSSEPFDTPPAWQAISVYACMHCWTWKLSRWHWQFSTLTAMMTMTKLLNRAEWSRSCIFNRPNPESVSHPLLAIS